MNKVNKIRIKYILVITLIGYFYMGHGQIKIDDVRKIEVLADMPKEDVFIHQNAITLFVGERLYYKFYCLDSKTKRLSNFSKIGHVEMIGSNRNPIFRHKIRLVDGMGKGDFFIPADIPTGNYKLIGYTNWMRNNVEHPFFESEVNIINLYHTNERSLITKRDSIKSDTSLLDRLVKVLLDDEKNIVKGLRLVPNKKMFGKREKVILKLEAMLGGKSHGNYSISVKGKDELIGSSISRVDVFNGMRKVKIEKNVNDSIYLPELRGELISGRVVHKETDRPAANKKIGFSIPGKEFLFKMANTNRKGEFHINLNESYDDGNSYIQVLEPDRSKYQINLYKSAIAYDELQFQGLEIATEQRESMLQRSVHNQIENAYFEAKQDSILQASPKEPFYKDFTTVYNLDDYTRFPTVQETFVEIIENAWISKTKEGKTYFRVRGSEFFSDPNFIPLVIVDGIMLQDFSDLMNFDARLIKRISISRNAYEFALQKFQGIIAIETFDRKTESFFNREYVQEIKLTAPLLEKKYFHPDYTFDDLMLSDRVPDYRYQLLWLPNLSLKNNLATIEFFTSDVLGVFEITLKGYTDDGQPVSIQDTIEVR